MLLVDSNILVYARSTHPRASACQALLAGAAAHPEWIIPCIVLLEVTHYYRDNGTYARQLLRAFTCEETLLDDVWWALSNSPSHQELNDHIILATAHRLGAHGVFSYDRFFERQSFFPDVQRLEP